MNSGDGIVQEWIGYFIFKDKEGWELEVWCMFNFFEIFFVIMIDVDGVVWVDIFFCCFEFKFSVE